MLDADLSILRDESDESFLVGLPALQHVLLLGCVEASAQEDPVAEFAREARWSADKLELIQDRINLANVLQDEGVQLWDWTLYKVY